MKSNLARAPVKKKEQWKLADASLSSAVLATDRLYLRPFSLVHLTEKYVGWLNDPEVVRFSEQRHHVHNLKTCQLYWRNLVDAGHILWGIELATDGRHIGNLAAIIDSPNASAELSVLIGEKTCWGKNYGTEAWGAACEYLLNIIGMRRLSAGTMAVNAGMRAIFTKTGMIEDGCRPRCLLLEGKEVDVVQASRFRRTSFAHWQFLRKVDDRLTA